MMEFQQAAFEQGQQTRARHTQRQCIRAGAACLELSWDYAALFLLGERHLADAYTRAALRAVAFQDGYLLRPRRETAPSTQFSRFAAPSRKKRPRSVNRRTFLAL